MARHAPRPPKKRADACDDGQAASRASGQVPFAPAGATGAKSLAPTEAKSMTPITASTLLCAPAKSGAAAEQGTSLTGANQGQDRPTEAGLPPLLADGVEPTSHGISVKHLERLLGGELLALAPRLPWAQLLRRTHGFDALRCTGCGGRLRLLAAITDKAVARAGRVNGQRRAADGEAGRHRPERDMTPAAASEGPPVANAGRPAENSAGRYPRDLLAKPLAESREMV